MSKYRGPRLRLVRKLGNLPGLTTKDSNKVNTPGQHGQPKMTFLKKLSPYGLRLLEKQKLSSRARSRDLSPIALDPSTVPALDWLRSG